MALGAPFSTSTRMDEQTADAVAITGGTIAGVTISTATISGSSLNLTGNETVGGTLAVTGASTLTGAITGGATLNLTGAETVGGTLVVTGASTLTGTATLPDGATWGATGVSDTANYATSGTTAPVNFSFTNSYSSTSPGVFGLSLAPTMTSAGASSGSNIQAVRIAPILANSANNIAAHQAVNILSTEAVSYTGTITTESVLAASASVAGNPFATLNLIASNLFATTNGNGITSGAVANNGLNVAPLTPAAGVGGTIANTAGLFNVPSSSSAGNTDRGIWITGNGGAASTKYALYSDSTAASVLAGNLTVQNATAIPAGGTAGAGLLVSATANFGVFFGSGAPSLSAAKGSLYLRSDGSGINDRMYVNTTGSTTWTAVVTVA